jgi:thiamine biosynthesis lipoprotein
MPDLDANLVLGHHPVEVMGTVVSFDLRDPVPTEALREAITLLHDVDAMFSTYRPDSVISQLRHHDIRATGCPPDVLEVLGLCEHAAEITEDYFTAFPGGELDPTGLVKGWAIQRASDVLRDAGSGHHGVNGGGDIQLVGGVDDSSPWRVGIAHPLAPGQVLAVASCRDAASGTAERGHHIVDPFTRQPASYFASVTVIAPRLIDADVLATAAFARGPEAPDWLEHLDGVEALFLDAVGTLSATAGFPFDA